MVDEDSSDLQSEQGRSAPVKCRSCPSRPRRCGHRINPGERWQGSWRAIGKWIILVAVYLRTVSIMRVSILLAAGLVACASNFGSARAGPCTADIAQFEATIRQSGGNPDAGLIARQSVGAQLSHQPTPGSVENAEDRLQAQFSAQMARAKQLDQEGSRTCIKALSAADVCTFRSDGRDRR